MNFAIPVANGSGGRHVVPGSWQQSRLVGIRAVVCLS